MSAAAIRDYILYELGVNLPFLGSGGAVQIILQHDYSLSQLHGNRREEREGGREGKEDVREGRGNGGREKEEGEGGVMIGRERRKGRRKGEEWREEQREGERSRERWRGDTKAILFQLNCMKKSWNHNSLGCEQPLRPRYLLSHPMRRTCFDQCQVSSKVTGSVDIKRHVRIYNTDI